MKLSWRGILDLAAELIGILVCCSPYNLPVVTEGKAVVQVDGPKARGQHRIRITLSDDTYTLRLNNVSDLYNVTWCCLLQIDLINFLGPRRHLFLKLFETLLVSVSQTVLCLRVVDDEMPVLLRD
jgi:hypothetical protein